MPKYESDVIKKAGALTHLLSLIDNVNKDIEASKKVKSDLMVRQYEHLKKQLTKDLLDLLAEYQLPVQLAEAA